MLKNDLRIAVLADDLTGITDTASVFFGLNYRCLFSLKNEFVPESRILFFNSRTRNLNSGKNFSTIQSIHKHFLGLCSQNEINLVYKKIDSTLRGPIPDEVLSLSELLNPGLIPFLPENPVQKRVYTGSEYLVNGFPIEQTFYAADPNNPSSKTVFFKLQSRLGSRFWAPPIFSSAELESAMATLFQRSDFNFIVASAAAAAFFPPLAADFPPPGTKTRKCLVISGSLNTLNSAQLELLRNFALEIPMSRLNQTDQYLSQSDLCLLDLSKAVSQVSFDQSLQTLSSSLLSKPNLIICGGETADSFLRCSSAEVLEVSGIAARGIPLCSDRNRLIIMKPGGFGEPDFYERCYQLIRSFQH
ncbi:MAG: four-carbon acid sugar kinase family protein [Candidatus Wallbacteria bacterium]|nr:four-carbon acid sugar kinase family protein [Candidatus Wallbacteria bacterium]